MIDGYVLGWLIGLGLWAIAVLLYAEYRIGKLLIKSLKEIREKK